MILPPPFTSNGKYVNAVIETPSGSTVKYKFIPELGCFKANKILPLGFHFPLDFGFVPGTVGEDGDPLDIMVLQDAPSCTGAVVECRIIGVLEAKQKDKNEPFKRNDRFLAVAKASHRFERIKKASDMDSTFISSLISFFNYYNLAQDRTFQSLGVKGAETAVKLLSTNASKHGAKK